MNTTTWPCLQHFWPYFVDPEMFLLPNSILFAPRPHLPGCLLSVDGCGEAHSGPTSSRTARSSGSRWCPGCHLVESQEVVYAYPRPNIREVGRRFCGQLPVKYPCLSRSLRSLHGKLNVFTIWHTHTHDLLLFQSCHKFTVHKCSWVRNMACDDIIDKAAPASVLLLSPLNLVQPISMGKSATIGDMLDSGRYSLTNRCLITLSIL